ncbi:sigma-70 family RNA polymerase sigma factor [Breoghania sp. L-A4]|uniref:RNA polymerase sigma factor n=1 Tax=Breoghania sp. L-A4 TaxID=2304600 RepID=UPI000E35FCF0|nr:sigma-70 family RNA polymerase sigma factor [Breoghania sp. L-A4]AXS39099.1 sigma-70 family RNA polymerase sigma factor [Breoghania sp. L-A4]
MTADPRRKVQALEALLVLDARRGGRQALARLVALRGPRLYAHAVRLSGDREAARDIVQDAWVQIIRGLQSLKDETAFLPWALRIVSRRVAADIRSRQKTRAIARDYASEAEHFEPARDPAQPDRDAVHAALKTLSAEQRATVALFYLEDMRVTEVAIALDIPVGTVKTRLMKARALLRDRLEGQLKGNSDG